jgi:hypothetical protein
MLSIKIKHSDSTKKFSETDIINMLEFLIDNIFVIFGGRVFQQTMVPFGKVEVPNISPRCSRGMIWEITYARSTIMYFLHETSLIWVISLGVKLWLVNFRSLHICPNCHIYAKYMINIYITPVSG